MNSWFGFFVLVLRRVLLGCDWLGRCRGLCATSTCLWKPLPYSSALWVCWVCWLWPRLFAARFGPDCRCQSGPGMVRSAGRVPAGFFAACLLLALIVTPGRARTHIFGSSACHGFCATAPTPACHSFLYGLWLAWRPACPLSDAAHNGRSACVTHPFRGG